MNQQPTPTHSKTLVQFVIEHHLLEDKETKNDEVLKTQRAKKDLLVLSQTIKQLEYSVSAFESSKDIETQIQQSKALLEEGSKIIEKLDLEGKNYQNWKEKRLKSKRKKVCCCLIHKLTIYIEMANEEKPRRQIEKRKSKKYERSHARDDRGMVQL
jgi:hypothetical protein